MNKKLFYILIAFVLAAVIFSTYWVLNKQPSQENIFDTNQLPIVTTPSQNTPSDTKTYRNDEFGFEFQYPKEWVIRREDKSVNYYSKLLLWISTPVIYNNEERFDLAFLVNIVIPKFVDTDFWQSQENTSKIVVGGAEGKKYEYEYEGFPHTTVILPLRDLKMILGTGDGEKQYLDEFNQILASFKFLK